MNTFLTVVLTVVGFFLVRFLFEPYRAVLDLRRQAQEALIIYGNLPKDAPGDDKYRLEASDTFRRIGVGLVSWHAAAPRRTKVLKLLKYRRWGRRWYVHDAGERLISLGNTVRDKGVSMASQASQISEIRKRLTLPCPNISAGLQRALSNEGDSTPPPPSVGPRP